MGSPYAYGQPICVWAAHIGIHILTHMRMSQIRICDRTHLMNYHTLMNLVKIQ